MIHVESINPANDHFVISSDEPVRIEISTVGSGRNADRIIAHAYRGVEVDPEQEPDAVYDGTVPSPTPEV